MGLMSHLDRNNLVGMDVTHIPSYFLGSNNLLHRSDTQQALGQDHRCQGDKGVVLWILEDSSDQLDICLHNLFPCHHSVDKSRCYLHCMLLYYLQWDQVCPNHKHTSDQVHSHLCSCLRVRTHSTSLDHKPYTARLFPIPPDHHMFLWDMLSSQCQYHKDSKSPLCSSLEHQLSCRRILRGTKSIPWHVLFWQSCYFDMGLVQMSLLDRSVQLYRNIHVDL